MQEAEERPLLGAEDPGAAQADRRGLEAEAAATRRPPVVAIFDLDGTLVVGKTQALLVRFLQRAGVLSRWYVIGMSIWFVAYKAGLVKDNESSRAKAAEVLKGLGVDEVAALMNRFVAEVLVPRLHPAAGAALVEHRTAGDEVVVVSAALDPLVEALCSRLGVGRFAGVPCELVDGRYTGRLDGPVPYRAEKARVAARFMAACGADPADCWAYADHDTDLELLRSVGHPVAVNPRPGLRAEAEREGWPILLSPERTPSR